MQQVERARPGLGGKGRAKEGMAAGNGQFDCITQCKVRGLVIHRIFAPDADRCAQALVRLLTREIGSIDGALSSSPHPTEPQAGEGAE